LDPFSTIDLTEKLLSMLVSITVIVAGVRALQGLSTRLESAVSGRIVSRDGVNYLMVKTTLKNASLFRVRSQSALVEIHPLQDFSDVPPPLSRDLTVPYESPKYTGYKVLEDLWTLEPSELIEDQRLIALSQDAGIAFGLRFVVVVREPLWVSIFRTPILKMWQARTIVFYEPEELDKLSNT